MMEVQLCIVLAKNKKQKTKNLGFMFSFFHTRQCLFHTIACDHLLNDPVIISVSSEKTKTKAADVFLQPSGPFGR